jgi:hypothetical protein
MPRPLEITCDVDADGRLPANRSRQLRQYLKLYSGREVRIALSAPKRSTAANSYYWGCVIPAIQRGMHEAGMVASAEAIHEAMKRRYLPARPSQDVFGEAVTLSPSTADLDATEFYEYVEAVRYDEDVLALGVDIPDPDPEYRSYKICEPA